MSSQKQSDEKLVVDDAAVTNLAVDFMLAMMRSASTDKIDPKTWWERAKNALETAADCADAPPRMVSKFLQKIQADVARKETSEWVAANNVLLSQPDIWRRFRAICRRDAVYIAAMAQIQRAEQRESEKGEREDLRPIWEKAYQAEEQIKKLRHENQLLSVKNADLQMQNNTMREAINGEEK